MDKTLAGAKVGDILLSLIPICELNGINPFDYLRAREQHAERVTKAPSDWLSWNYRPTLRATSRG